MYSDTKVVRVSRDDLARLKVPVPSAEKQAEIGDAMDTVDRQIAATTVELESTQLARAALLDAMLTRAIEVILDEPPAKDIAPQQSLSGVPLPVPEERRAFAPLTRFSSP